MPVASSSPAPIQRSGLIRRRASTHCVPPIMYWMIIAIDTVSPAAKPPPGRSWPRSKQEERDHADHREQQPREDGGDQQPVRDGVPLLAVRPRDVIGALVALLLRDVDAVGGRAEAPQQRIDGQRHRAEHGDLAQGIEAPEIDQDHVDDVGAAAFAVGPLQEVAAQIVSGAAASSRRRTRAAMPAPAVTAMDEVAQAARRGDRLGRRVNRRSSKRFGSQRRPSRSRTVVTTSTSKLRQGEVGRGEPDEGHADDQPGAAEQDQCGEPVKLGLPGSAEGAGRTDGPDQREARDRCPSPAGCPAQATPVERPERRERPPRPPAAATGVAGAGCRTGPPASVRRPKTG